jgi:hypothetical protein
MTDNVLSKLPTISFSQDLCPNLQVKTLHSRNKRMAP